ncbi:16019_t:CDS:2 [Cetraspora pellucida]|uniref:16019_t:CDS:1 n=1 Tax=Cetraspora pellucida TaxID=1433469 RepID=A0A9N8WBU7_9GLOM|nr:16019_t:CDS:2 [Cetraspora pellucida]
MALKYAGSDDKKAFKCLLSYLDLFMGLESTRRASTFDENITISAIKSCLNVLSTSVSIVAASGGNLEVLRRIRKIHQQEVDTSSSRSFTLSTSNKAIAGLVCALFPRYPIESYGNRAHFQAIRHLWVLAVEPRCLVLRDIETKEACHIPSKILAYAIRIREILEFDRKFWKEKLDPQGLRDLLTRIFPDGKILVVQAFTQYLYEDFNANVDEQALSAFCDSNLSKLYQIQQDMEGINEIDLWNVMFIMKRYFEIPFDVFVSFLVEHSSLSSTANMEILVKHKDIFHSYFTDTKFLFTEQLGGEESKKRLLQYLAKW